MVVVGWLLRGTPSGRRAAVRALGGEAEAFHSGSGGRRSRLGRLFSPRSRSRRHARRAQVGVRGARAPGARSRGEMEMKPSARHPSLVASSASAPTPRGNSLDDHHVARARLGVGGNGAGARERRSSFDVVAIAHRSAVQGPRQRRQIFDQFNSSPSVRRRERADRRAFRHARSGSAASIAPGPACAATHADGRIEVAPPADAARSLRTAARHTRRIAGPRRCARRRTEARARHRPRGTSRSSTRSRARTGGRPSYARRPAQGERAR